MSQYRIKAEGCSAVIVMAKYPLLSGYVDTQSLIIT